MASLNIIRTRTRSLFSPNSHLTMMNVINLCKNKCFSRHVRNRLAVHHPIHRGDHKQVQVPVMSQSTLSNVPQLDIIKRENDEKSEEDASEILRNLSTEDAKKLKIIKLEFEVLGHMNGMVPQTMTDAQWLVAFEKASRHQRLQYYKFLKKKENYVKKEKEKRQQRLHQQRQQQQQEEDKKNDVIPESPQLFSKNSIFMFLRDTTVDKAGNYRLANAMMYGTPLIFDMDYEQFMRDQDCSNLVDQLLMVHGKNRDSMDPFHLIFTSLNPKGKVFPMMEKRLLQGQHFLATVTDRSYLDLFPSEKLVYLSPHAPNALKEVSSDDIYIVGGFIDKAYGKPVSFARAKAQGIRSAKLPLDHFLLWGCGSKNLTLDQMMGILLEQRRSKDWNKAFKEVPIRKMKREDK
ncbi:tRNA methyltransferase 10 homolog C-like [Pomacea canaliculata]|nr:tRNA methyltransferase 10 homolog C-like [Pomacea canaliculata]